MSARRSSTSDHRLLRRRHVARRRPGRPADLGRPGHRRAGRRGPAGRRGGLRRGLPRRPRRPARLGGHPGARARAGGRAHRPDRRGQQGSPGRAGHPGDRQAAGRVPRRGAGSDRHLLVLRGRGAAPLRPDRAQRDARQAAVHVPGAGRRRGDRHGGQLPGRRAVLVRGARAAVRQRRGVEARGVHPRHRARVHRAVRRGRAPRAACSTPCSPTAPPPTTACPRPSTTASCRRSGSPARRRSGCGSASSPGRHLQNAVPRAGRQEPAGRDARRRPRPGRRGRALLRLRHGGPALHVAGHGDRARVGARRVPRPVRRGRAHRRASATPPTTCCTAR